MLIDEMLVRKLNYQGEFVVEGSTKRRWLQGNDESTMDYQAGLQRHHNPRSDCT
jgi:hypothetical protein